MANWLKTVGAVFATIVAIWVAGYGASAFFDTRYTLARTMEQHEQRDAQQFAETRLLFLQNRQGQLEEQQFKFELEKEHRPLLRIERERKDQVDRELKRIEKQIEQEQKKANPKGVAPTP